MEVREIKESDNFKRIRNKLDKNILIKVNKIIKKIIENPGIGKPMRYERKGTRELYVSPFRFSYAYIKENQILYFLNLYHKKRQ
tara:strand:+ start:1690 stop:1941 length:252 start_codon:yes stop_codon:yes gene_type:complete